MRLDKSASTSGLNFRKMSWWCCRRYANQVMRGIAVALSVTDHDDPAGGPQGFGDPCIKALILRHTLATLARLILVREMVKEVMRIVWADRVVRLIGGRNVQPIDPSLTMLHGHEHVRKAGRCRGRYDARPR